MKAELQALCDLFIANRDIARQAFKWDSDAVHPLCANIFCSRGMTMDIDRLQQCREIINNQTGILSNFRGNLRPALAAMLAAGERPEEKMSQALENYRILKQDFWGSEYLAMVAFLLTDIADTFQVEEKAGRGKTIYQRMKKEHPFLTSSEDSVFAVMMAFSEKTDDALIADMEACYQGLKTRFFIGNSLQTVSHVLAMADSDPAEKVDRVIQLYESLRNAGVKYSRDYELATLAALAAMDVDLPTITAEICEVDEFLSSQKGYGFFGPGKGVRAMHAAMIVSDQFATRDQVDTAAMAGTLAMIIAQQMAMIAVMASASASAASSSSH
ncbi:MAG: DUF4003 domain-containing protein [Clostridia bacterium]|nr:DUF4003 domain-containing protein [Clostridia bacterium]